MLAKTIFLLLPMSLALASPVTVTDLAKRAPTAHYTVSQSFTMLAQNPPIITLDNGIGFYMQMDGNFVVYTNGDVAAADAAWSSGTGGHNCAGGSGHTCWLNWQTDGNLVVYIKSGTAAWASNTAGTGQTLLLSDQAPYIQIFNSANKVVWSTPKPTSGGGPGNGCNPKTGVCP